MLIKLLNKQELLQIKNSIDSEIPDLGNFDFGLVVALEIGYLYIGDQVQRLTVHAEPSFYAEELYILSSKQSSLIQNYFIEKLKHSKNEIEHII